MSLGYAEKLSFKEDVGGSLGAPEVFDAATELAQSIEKLIQLVSEARSIIAFTGAGISTSTGIPDFRGPNGVWTAQKLGTALPKATVEFANAAPSLTHQALLALHGTGKLKYLVSQNVDGLHRRSGFPAAALAELHGNCFLERCSTCGATFTRDFEVETVGFMETGRFCEVQGCRGPLTDTVLDWDDALPAKELKEAELRAKHADLAICLGTSLQIRPACNLPLRTVRVYKDRPQAGKLVIVNLQRTQHDKKALTSGGLVIHARTDDVMRGLMAGLHMQVPEYKRLDTFVLEVALIEQEAKRVKSPMTMTEKIIANHSDSSVVRPGSNIWTRVDKLMTHDVCGPGTFGIFQKEFGENAEVWDRERVVLMPDHYIFTSDERANRNVDILRDMAKRYNIKYFYDITDRSDFRANPDYKGVCHVALAQEGHCKPGEVMFGTDSHTCNAGAFGQFATGVGNTDAGFILGTGKLLIKVPPTMRFEMVGQMPPYLLAKDLILHIIGEISVAGGTYRAMEFSGEAISNMSMEERMTICNMVIEAGGKNGMCPPDETTFDYVTQRTSEPFEPVYADSAAQYVESFRFDVSKLEPTVAAPHSPDNRKLARECRHVKIDRVYIGSCTGGKTEDFMAAAKLFHAAGQQVWADVYALPVPGCGGKTAAQIFEAAGCITPAAPSCAACLGGPRDTFARMNEAQVCVSTTNRNFPGRMGHKDGQVYLASPFTAAASALAGHVADPRDYM
ncbi:3-isopropylmalate dehydratase [Auxenochlorella protothecoides]|uniref:protein acetyllysine N-acetyltransferase n=1 Tax=Auxenochlorella protothecoides TaxID=3075 RepID=A0A087SJV4_AUXPR|nr:3-isopropylmalate dehydratase [Auxenochlorella protothecoides]KFM26008.1 3-isopropylmalate dehydratase [Auxenochlorella protothecoides]